MTTLRQAVQDGTVSPQVAAQAASVPTTLREAIERGMVTPEAAVEQLRAPTFGEQAKAAGRGLAGALVSTTLSGDAAILRAIGMGTAADKFIDYAEGIKRGMGDDALQMENQGLFGRGGQTLFKGVGSLVGLAGIPVPGGPAVQSATRFGLVSAGQGFYEAKAHGADDGTAWKSYLANGALGAAVGAIPGTAVARLGKILARADVASGGLLKRSLVSGLNTGAQMGIQTAGSNAIASVLYDDDRRFLEGVLPSMGEGALVGVFAGALLHGKPEPKAGQAAGGQAKENPGKTSETPATSGGSESGAASPEAEGSPSAPSEGAAPSKPLRIALTDDIADAVKDAAAHFGETVHPVELPPEAAAMAKRLGLRVIAVEGESGAPLKRPGWYDTRRTTAVIDANAPDAYASLLDHEIAHHVTDNVPGAANRFRDAIDAIRPGLREQAIEEYVADEVANGTPEEDARAAAGAHSEDVARIAEDFSPVLRLLRSNPEAFSAVEDVGFWRTLIRSVLDVGRRVAGRPTSAEARIADVYRSVARRGTSTTVEPREGVEIAKALVAFMQEAEGLGRATVEPVMGVSGSPEAAASADASGGETALAPEKGGVSDRSKVSVPREISPPTPPKFATPRRTLPDVLDQWLGKRQLSETEAEVRALNKDETLVKMAGSRAKARDLDRAMHVYIDLKGRGETEFAKYGAGLSDAQKALYKASQSLTPAERAFADKIAEENRAVAERHPEIIKTARENYTARVWKQPDTDATKFGKFTTSTARAKARTLDSVLHGFALGKELQVEGAIGAQKLMSQQVARASADKGLIKEGIRAGILSHKQPEGWVEVEHPNFKTYRPVARAAAGAEYSELKSYGADTYVTDDGTIMARAPLYAPPSVAKQLNAVVGSSKIRNLPGVEGLSRWNKIIKESILYTSLYHHQAFIRESMLGGPFKNTNPITSYRDGAKMIRDFGPEVQDLVRKGLTIGKLQDYDELARRDTTEVGKIIAKIPGAPAAKAALTRLRDQQQDFLFHRLGPNLKTHAAVIEMADLLRRGVPRDEAARQAAKFANDRFGGLNLQRMGRDPTIQHGMHLLTLAPDWTESNLRAFVKAFGTADESKLYRRMWGRVLVKAGLATIAANLVLASMDDRSFAKRYSDAWERGRLRWLDVDITPIYHALGGHESGVTKYFSIVGHYRDAMRLIDDPVTFIKHKESVLSSLVWEALNGKDWKDEPFTSWKELLKSGKTVDWRAEDQKGSIGYSQVPSFALNRAKGTLPTQLQNAIAWLTGEMDGFDAMAKSIGLMESSSRRPKK